MRVLHWILVTICWVASPFQATTCLAQSLDHDLVPQQHWPQQRAVSEVYKWTDLPNGLTEYTDRLMGLSFKIDRDWRVDDIRADEPARWRGSDWTRDLRDFAGLPATTTWLGHHGTHESVRLYYRVVNRTATTKAEIQKLLLADVDDKVSQRRTDSGWRDYHIRSMSYEEGEIDGWPSLTWVADYTQGKHKMVEYLVGVRSETTIAQFIIQCPADQLDQVRERVKPIIQSLRIR